MLAAVCSVKSPSATTPVSVALAKQVLKNDKLPINRVGIIPFSIPPGSLFRRFVPTADKVLNQIYSLSTLLDQFALSPEVDLFSAGVEIESAKGKTIYLVNPGNEVGMEHLCRPQSTQFWAYVEKQPDLFVLDLSIPATVSFFSSSLPWTADGLVITCPERGNAILDTRSWLKGFLFAYPPVKKPYVSIVLIHSGNKPPALLKEAFADLVSNGQPFVDGVVPIAAGKLESLSQDAGEMSEQVVKMINTSILLEGIMDVWKVRNND